MIKDSIYFNSIAISRLLEKEWAVAHAGLGLSPSQALALREIIRVPRITPSKLALALFIQRPTASRVVDVLVKRHFVERQYSKKDARECFLIPTPFAFDVKDELEAAEAIAARALVEKMGLALTQAMSGCFLSMLEILSDSGVDAGEKRNDEHAYRVQSVS